MKSKEVTERFCTWQEDQMPHCLVCFSLIQTENIQKGFPASPGTLAEGTVPRTNEGQGRPPCHKLTEDKG